MRAPPTNHASIDDGWHSVGSYEDDHVRALVEVRNGVPEQVALWTDEPEWDWLPEATDGRLEAAISILLGRPVTIVETTWDQTMEGAQVAVVRWQEQDEDA